MRILRILVLILVVLSLPANAHAQAFGSSSFGSPTTTPIILSASTSQTLVAYQGSTVFVLNKNGGVAPNGSIMTLPTASPKLDYTFIVDAAVYIRIKPQSGDIINFSTNITGSKVKNTSSALGDSIEVFCVVAGQWSVKNRVGTWVTDNNPG